MGRATRALSQAGEALCEGFSGFNSHTVRVEEGNVGSDAYPVASHRNEDHSVGETVSRASLALRGKRHTKICCSRERRREESVWRGFFP